MAEILSFQLAQFFGGTSLRWLATLDPKSHPPPIHVAIPVSITAGFVLVYGIPLLHRVFPTKVVIFENGIFHMIGEHGRRWEFDSILHCDITTRQLDNEIFRILVIVQKKEQLSMLGIAPEVSLDELESVLRSKDIAVNRLDKVIGPTS